MSMSALNFTPRFMKVAQVGSSVCRRTMNSHRKLYTQMDEGAMPHHLLHLYEENEAGHRCIRAGQVKPHH